LYLINGVLRDNEGGCKWSNRKKGKFFALFRCAYTLFEDTGIRQVKRMQFFKDKILGQVVATRLKKRFLADVSTCETIAYSGFCFYFYFYFFSPCVEKKACYTTPLHKVASLMTCERN